MDFIDGCVFPYPIGSATQARLIDELKELGYSGMVSCSTGPGIHCPVARPGDFVIYPGRCIKNPSIRDIQQEIASAGKAGAVTIVQAGENNLNRSILTTKGVNILSELHLVQKNAFDRFCAHLAAEKGIAIEIKISPLCELRGTPRQKVIRAYEEVLTLQSRFEFPLVISSGARTVTSLRSPRAIEMLLLDLGWDLNLIRSSLNTIPDLISGNSPVRVVREGC